MGFCPSAFLGLGTVTIALDGAALTDFVRVVNKPSLASLHASRWGL